MDAGIEVDGSTIWEESAVTADVWLHVVEERRRERRRLETPPKDYHLRPAFAALRSLLLESSEFRKAFLAVKWRGRPTGIPLLAALLQKRAFVPEVATDHEYLDAELDDLTGTEPESRPEAGVWKFGDWTVRREGNHALGFRYSAQSGAKAE